MDSGADRYLIAFSFCCCGGPSDFVSDVDLFAEQRSVFGVLPLAPDITVCHNCSVPGFTDGAGFCFGWMLQLLLLKQHLSCDDVVKTENLDWIFLLDVSLV
jgi:hypothetical protein